MLVTISVRYPIYIVICHKYFIIFHKKIVLLINSVNIKTTRVNTNHIIVAQSQKYTQQLNLLFWHTVLRLM